MNWTPDSGDCPEGCWPLCLCSLWGDPIAINIVKAIRDRLILGRQLHGPWTTLFKYENGREALEEHLDGQIYATAGLMAMIDGGLDASTRADEQLLSDAGPDQPRRGPANDSNASLLP